jgi:hypothetical protein
MSLSTSLELLLAAALIVGGVLLYRRRGAEDSRHGSQGAVILMILGAILAIHGLGLLDYRPSAWEIGR